MNVLLWNLQAVLAAVFLRAGAMKAFRRNGELVRRLPALQGFSPATLRFTGAAELAAVAGLLLPGALGVATVLTPLAATGLAVVMLLAATVHAGRREPPGVALTAVLLIMSVAVAWGRFGPYPL
ncbi:hypothetical protein Acsp04_36890 [Actinomadura sp. NBRC 104425]|uniref:DoxX family protein n=1 Tax=Actinomadura sp. NBRC 104425 TaxID=3032204 RepID=UPI0024A48CD9|nr:DoxX family protein [Actinomadura sp. NBRC 104425]GLZ13454.1 hypothetical protein Acsp04_36890 [Actinomadura sp. NBRC 104425]